LLVRKVASGRLWIPAGTIVRGTRFDLLEPIGNVPLAEAEEHYYVQLNRTHSASSGIGMASEAVCCLPAAQDALARAVFSAAIHHSKSSIIAWLVLQAPPDQRSHRYFTF
jgi:hypothetical protein